MGKKKSNMPNAPELQHILLESPTAQPPQNPYYPDLNSSTFARPPPYSDISSSVLQQRPNYPTYNMAATSHNLPRQGPPTVVIQQAPIFYDRRAEKHSRKVKTFNTEMLIVAFSSMLVALYARGLYDERPCIESFIVLQPMKDMSVTIRDVREAHLTTAYTSIFIMIVCLIKFAFNSGRSHSCYLFIIGLTTFVATLHTLSVAYAAFYSPCVMKASELASNTLRTMLGTISDSLPSPSRGLLNESNVFQLRREDPSGALIFYLDMINFILYLSGFVTALMLC